MRAAWTGLLVATALALIFVGSRQQQRSAVLVSKETGGFHPHPRIRSGVFSKTFTQLSAAIQALAAGSEHQLLDCDGDVDPAACKAALGSEAAASRHVPSRQKSSSTGLLLEKMKQTKPKAHRAAITVSSGRRYTRLVKALKESEARDLQLEQEIERLSHVSMQKLPMHQLPLTDCSSAKQFDKNLAILTEIKEKDRCRLPNLWDDTVGKCVKSPLHDTSDEPAECISKEPTNTQLDCLCKNWRDAHVRKLKRYQDLLLFSEEFESSKNTLRSTRQSLDVAPVEADPSDPLKKPYTRQYRHHGSDVHLKRKRWPRYSNEKMAPYGDSHFPHKSWVRYEPTPQRYHRWRPAFPAAPLGFKNWKNFKGKRGNWTGGADLGDNWISGWSDEHPTEYEEDLHEELEDHMASADEATSQLPTLFRTFVNDGEADEGKYSRFPLCYHHQGYWRRLPVSNAEAQLLLGNTTESYELRKFADCNFAFAKESPLNRSTLDLVWGKGHHYLSDRYGAMVDVYPSTTQVYEQLVHPNSKWVQLARYQDKQFPRITPLVQRWRKGCPECDFREVLEKQSKECVVPSCQEVAPEEVTPPKYIRICNVADCKVVKGPSLRARDALKDQILKGEIHGIADPFGLAGLVEDTRKPAEAILGMRHDHRNFGSTVGEPLSDFLHSNWDVANGRTASVHDGLAEEETDIPRHYASSFHSKHDPSGATFPPDAGGMSVVAGSSSLKMIEQKKAELEKVLDKQDEAELENDLDKQDEAELEKDRDKQDKVDLEEQDDEALAARHKALPLKTLQQKVAALEKQNSLESKMNSLLAKNEKLAQQNSMLSKNLGLLVR